MTKRVSIVAMGASRTDFMAGSLTASENTREAEIWAINLMATVIVCDRVIAMDPIDMFLDPSIASMTERDRQRFKALTVPIITSEPSPNFPSSIPFPLDDVLKTVRIPYMNTSVAYAVALAIHEKFDEISLYGCDFTYPQLHEGEKGRACIEFWLGIAMSKGIAVHVAGSSSLLDSGEVFSNGTRLYGYRTNPLAQGAKPCPDLSL